MNQNVDFPKPQSGDDEARQKQMEAKVEEVRKEMMGPRPYPTQQHPYPILAYFSYGHLPEGLQRISKPLAQIAQEMAATLPNNPEVSAGLRKLLEAKDCFVRAALPVGPPQPQPAPLKP